MSSKIIVERNANGEKLSELMVNKMIPILVVMLHPAVVSIFCSRLVEVNENMTKYLPDSSNMNAGLYIMESEFPDMETADTIRVMFDDLTESDKATVSK